MGCEQSSLSSSNKGSMIGNRMSKKASMYIEENKSKDPPSRPMSKMDTKSMISHTTQATKTQPIQEHGDTEKDGASKQLEFSLDSKLEDLINDTVRKMSGSILNKEELDVCLGQLTKEQHNEIYLFAKECSRLVHSYSMRLHENLISSMKESSDLPMIMENMKCSSKDIENCIDDLKAFPVPSEQSFYKELDERLMMSREVRREYGQYMGGAKSYEEFRNATLDLLWGYSAGIGDKYKNADNKEKEKNKEEAKKMCEEVKPVENIVMSTVEKSDEIKEKGEVKTPPTQEGSREDLDVDTERDSKINKEEELDVEIKKEESEIREEVYEEAKEKGECTVKEDAVEEEMGNVRNEKGAL